jgi:hypothetical protein
MEGVFVSHCCRGWEGNDAGRVAGIEGGDNVILCRPRTEVGDAMGAE